MPFVGPLVSWERSGRSGAAWFEGAVRTVVVVMALALAQHGCGVSLVDDQEAIEEFASDAADEAFGDRMGTRCPHRRPDDADVDCGEDGVEGSGERGVAVADEEPKATPGVVEVHEEIAGLLGQPGSGGVGGDPEDVHVAGGVLDDEEDIQPAQGDRLKVKQVAGEDRVRVGAQKLRPRWSGSSG